MYKIYNADGRLLKEVSTIKELRRELKIIVDSVHYHYLKHSPKMVIERTYIESSSHIQGNNLFAWYLSRPNENYFYTCYCRF